MAENETGGRPIPDSGPRGLAIVHTLRMRLTEGLRGYCCGRDYRSVDLERSAQADSFHRRRHYRRCRKGAQNDGLLRHHISSLQPLEQLVNSSVDANLRTQPWRFCDCALRSCGCPRCLWSRGSVSRRIGGSLHDCRGAIPLDSTPCARRHQAWACGS